MRTFNIKPNILHITPHLGGGVGTVIMDWIKKASVVAGDHIVLCLDTANEKAKKWATETGTPMGWNYSQRISGDDFYSRDYWITNSDIVLVHYWDHPMLADLFSRSIPECRLVFWCHKNIYYPPEVVLYPDRWIDTSPIQGNEYIWSTRDISRFLEIQPKAHEGFNIGYVGTVDYKKIHPMFPQMCFQILDKIPDARFTFVGENTLPSISQSCFTDKFTFTGKVDNVAPYLAEMDVFGYPLRTDHYGTCEQVLGEAMAAGVPVVVNE